MGCLCGLIREMKKICAGTIADSTRGASPAHESTGGAGTLYAAYIKSLLDYEQTRKVSLEGKASAVITTSGALVALLFGLVAVITGSKTFVLSTASHGWLGAAMILFVVAAAFAIVGNGLPVGYGDVQFDAKNLEELFAGPALDASVNVAQAQLEQTAIAKKQNNRKAKLVIAGVSSELAALAMLTVALFQIVGK